ncbi:uncharacterized protein LOC120258301 isoform X2 [Dioscorea cayenensis subsp. rotundata]|uniref:Uncharacterized protein LOC120258301 isoform X2 n=1 Tax=Dioscorea cayennensis subsp. rotundata TaxID=55577 RepID=A0AB40B2P3_DIOCR|nr:uncharacterized protein LOC120258301 isoform X2 [Dioscorea cayenensis subsp. rotundata]
MDPRSPATTTTIPLKSNDEKNLTYKEFQAIDRAIQREDFAFLQEYVKATSNGELRWVNLSKDPLLNVMIAYDSKDDILLKLIDMMTPKALKAKNKVGDTALHVAAAMDRKAVATALILKNDDLIHYRNKNWETPLLRAARFGSADTFDCLLSYGSDIFARNEDGSSVLHCNILGNNPVIPLNSHNDSKKLGKKRDEEAPHKSTSSEHSKYWVEDDKDNAEDDKFLKESKAKSSKKFLKNCQRYVTGGAFQVRFYIILILKKLSKRVEKLEEQKTKHAQTMKLIAYLARDPDYWDFIQHGIFRQEIDDDDDSDDDDDIEYRTSDAPFDSSDERATISPQNEKIPSCCLEIKNLISKQTNLIKEQNNLFKEFKKESESKKEPEPTRWHDSPLIVGAKMGLHDYVEQILKACPQSVEIKDMDGTNILQVAIKHRYVKIVKIIAEMINGPNPVLPTWLLSDVDMKDNTILHYAAETTIKGEGLALQMRHEIKWFEMVKKLLPKDMEYSRNIKEKTAHELFDQNHAEMVKSGRDQLMEIGKTCSGLLAAVVFATSFNIPGGKDSDNNAKNNMTNTEGNHFSNESVGFKVFTQAYMIGLSLATCSLILFLSFLTSNYSPEAFRKSLPTRCILAGVSFFCALMALLVAFVCNAYLTIYGGGKPKAEDLLPLILELTGFPLLWAVVWFFGGFGSGFLDFILKKFRR